MAIISYGLLLFDGGKWRASCTGWRSLVCISAEQRSSTRDSWPSPPIGLSCFASVEMGQTVCSNKLQLRAEVLPWPRRLASASPPRRRLPSLRLHLLEHTPVSDLCADDHGYEAVEDPMHV